MIEIKDFTEQDIPALQTAIDADTFHPGAWKVTDFTHPSGVSEVIGDSNGPIIFARYEKTLRISCVWANESDTQRNGKAVIIGIKAAVEKARASGFTEIAIRADHPPVLEFLTKAIGMKHVAGECVLAV